MGFWKVPPQPQSMLLTGDHFEYASNEVYWKTWQWQERVAVWTPPAPKKKKKKKEKKKKRKKRNIPGFEPEIYD